MGSDWPVFCDYGVNVSSVWCLSLHLPSYLGFSYLGHEISFHSCSSKVQPLLPTLDEGYLLMAAPPDFKHGVAPLRPLAPTQPLLLGRGIAPLGHCPWPRARVACLSCHPMYRKPIFAVNEVVYQGISHNIKELLLGGMSAKNLFKWIPSLPIVSISVESVTLRSMKLNSCIIDYFYATLAQEGSVGVPYSTPQLVFKTHVGSFFHWWFPGCLVLAGFMVVSSKLPRCEGGMLDSVVGWWEQRALGTHHRDCESAAQARRLRNLGNATEGPGELTHSAFQMHLIT